MATDKSTRYKVLEKSNAHGAWVEKGDTLADNARQAIKLVLEHSSLVETTGLYVAVPDRSWHPETVSVVSTTRLQFGAENGGGAS